jgi:hypothetical protein
MKGCKEMTNELLEDEVMVYEFDYSMLKGKIVEVYGSGERFAMALGISAVSLSGKLNNQVGWKQKEIVKICELLDIPTEFIPVYFFTKKVYNSKLSNGEV